VKQGDVVCNEDKLTLYSHDLVSVVKMRCYVVEVLRPVFSAAVSNVAVERVTRLKQASLLCIEDVQLCVVWILVNDDGDLKV